jgi:hypothetical protein
MVLLDLADRASLRVPWSTMSIVSSISSTYRCWRVRASPHVTGLGQVAHPHLERHREPQRRGSKRAELAHARSWSRPSSVNQ